MDISTVFVIMIFSLVALISQTFVTPVMGSRRQAKKRLRNRLVEIKQIEMGAAHIKLMRERYLDQLSPFERRLETLQWVELLREKMNQAGMSGPAYRFVLRSILFGIAAAGVAVYLIRDPAALLVGPVAAAIPFVLLIRRRKIRLRTFEEQLPEALSIAARSLRAGLPFGESLNIVATEMDGPISEEFGQLFNELNFGGDVRSGFMSLLARMPTVAVMAVVSAVLIQRETGGNLAEVLDKIASIIRERFRFQRTVRTLTAEGRGTSYVVIAMPFILAGAAELLEPGWVTDMLADPGGYRMFLGAFVLMVVGILWLRKMVNIDV